MSRSYKKTPGFTDQQKSGRRAKYMKRLSNKRVRQFPVEEYLPNGRFHRKHFLNPWDICDYKFLFFSDKEIEDVVSFINGLGVHSNPTRNKKYKYYIK